MLFVVVLALIVSIDAEVSDTVCELFLVVVVVSLVSFSSFADVTAEPVTVVAVWLTAEVSALSAESDTFPQAVSITAQSIDMTIALFILYHSFL